MPMSGESSTAIACLYSVASQGQPTVGYYIRYRRSSLSVRYKIAEALDVVYILIEKTKTT
ncbi:hypothetical protein KP79_PYT10779 [Mizuhopecten yessoensis]|uniref:Uncharacterized protein n=1 Tax=Mizuhopecten yessoensis TaxID=6573 RepID=A0A210QIU8_MIZYE|nr:hypothetical protein KP79_PYT10779 [Mizuhopecten yessoensis]